MRHKDFAIGSAMIHDVPRGDRDASEITLTDAPIHLDDQLRGYFGSKIMTSLKTRGVEVVADPTQDSPVCAAVAGIITDAAALPAQSQLIAARLHEVQTGVNPAGLLAVILGIADGQPALSVLKLEREEGIRFRVHEADGHRVVDLEFLKDLTLTNKTKVFKTSLFVLTDLAHPESLIGTVSDDQRGQVHGRHVADFFLTTFLGCQLRVNPARATFEFVRATQEFINEAVPNPEKQGRYQVALLATMQDQRLDVSPLEFAANNLETPDRPLFLDRVRQHGLEPGSAFEKDTSLVKVNGFRMTFKNGMVLVGSPDDLRDRIHIHSQHEPPGVDVNDAVKELQGR